MKPDLEHSKIKKEKVVLNYYKSYSKGPGLDIIKPSVKNVKKSKKLVLTGTHLKTRKRFPESEQPVNDEPPMPKVIGSVPKTIDKVIMPDETLIVKPDTKPKSPIKREVQPVKEESTTKPPVSEIDPTLLA